MVPGVSFGPMFLCNADLARSALLLVMDFSRECAALYLAAAALAITTANNFLYCFRPDVIGAAVRMTGKSGADGAVFRSSLGSFTFSSLTEADDATDDV